MVTKCLLSAGHKVYINIVLHKKRAEKIVYKFKMLPKSIGIPNKPCSATDKVRECVITH